MLVLTRNLNQTIDIYNPDGSLLGSIQLCRVGKDSAGIGLNFPREYAIIRPDAKVKTSKDKSNVVSSDG